MLPPAFAQESLQPLSPSVRVEMAQIDELSGLAHELSIEMQKLASMADRFLIAAGLGAREQFDFRLQRAPNRARISAAGRTSGRASHGVACADIHARGAAGG